MLQRQGGWLALALGLLVGAGSVWADALEVAHKDKRVADDAASKSGWSGYVGLEGRLFFEDPLYPDQEEHSLGFQAEPEYQYTAASGRWVFRPFVRLDSADSERSHADIRELSWSRALGSDLNLQLGVGKVFWGVTEFQHLVDIVNQTDLVEFPEGEDKLGQPMVRLDWAQGSGTLSLFVLPYFRERTFPGAEGRLRFEPYVDTDLTQYEDPDKQQHVDFAARYHLLLGDLELALSHFSGTSRDPSFRIAVTPDARFVLAPYYEQIDQTGLEVLWANESWLWKLEAIHRSGQEDLLGLENDYFAFTGGFEYAFSDAGIAGAELNLLVEYLYDDRDELANSAFANDLFVGLRLGLNDAADTSALLAWGHDLDGHGDLIKLEGSRRLGEAWKLNLDALLFFNQDEIDYLYSSRDDSLVQLRLNYHF